MKNILFYINAVILAGALFTSCVENDFDSPEGFVIPVGNEITLKNVITDSLGTDEYYDFKTDQTIYGTITMDDKSGNIYKQAYFQSGDMAFLVGTSSSGLYQGDSIRINLKGLRVSDYRGMAQLFLPNGNGFDLNKSVTKIASGKDLAPERMSVTELLAMAKQPLGRLITLTNVQFKSSEFGKTFADVEGKNTENRELVDAANQSVSISVRTSGYANFAGMKVPEKRGEITGIFSIYESGASVYNQFYIRKSEEIKMEEDLTAPATGEGTGTKDDPFNVKAAMVDNSGTGKWVKGFIVGIYETKDASGSNLDDNVAKFEGPFYTNSNLLIADKADETNLENCLTVQLPYGDIRTAINLVDNADKKGKEVLLLGDLTAYFGVAGLKNTVGYYIDGVGIEPQPVSGFFVEEFNGSLGDFAKFNVNGTKSWAPSSFNNDQFAKVSGGNSSANQATENEAWLISPAIDMTSKSNVVMEFRHDANYVQDKWDFLEVFVSKDYDGTSSPDASGTWTKLTGYTNPDGGKWGFVKSGEIDMSAYQGQAKVFVAFKYRSTKTISATWEIDYVTLNEK